MDKFSQIRPIVLGVAIKDGKLLVSEGYDKLKDQAFYRCLGGGIEFLEKSDEALKREFVEELGIEITTKDFLGIAENIFTFEGKNGHELVFFYSIDINDSDYKDEYTILDMEKETKVKWIDIEDLKSKKQIVYPQEVLKYL